MMETRLIMLPQPILCVGDDFHNNNLTGKDFAFHWGSKKVVEVLSKNIDTGSWLCSDGTHRDSYKLLKIIAGLPDLPKLNLSLIAEKIGWVDVEKLAKEYSGMRSAQSNSVDTSLHNARVAAFREDYKTNQSINEKKYNKEYERVAKTSIYHILENYGQLNGGAIKDEITDKIFQSLSKPKEYLVQVEMEVNQCDGCISGYHIIDSIHKAPYPSGSMVCKKHLYDRPKITNNTIKVTKVL